MHKKIPAGEEPAGNYDEMESSGLSVLPYIYLFRSSGGIFYIPEFFLVHVIYRCLEEGFVDLWYLFLLGLEVSILRM